MFNKNNIVETIEMDVAYRSNPADTFYELCGDKKNTLLLESVEINKKYQVESMMIIDTAIRITAYTNVVILESFSENGKAVLEKIHFIIPKEIKMYIYPGKVKLLFPFIMSHLNEDEKLHAFSVFDTFRFLLKLLKSNSKKEKSVFFGGLFSYDLVSSFEKIPKLYNTQKCPDFCFYLSEILLIMNHINKTSTLQGSLFFKNDTEKKRLIKKLFSIKNQLSKLPIEIPNKKVIGSSIKLNFNDLEYQKIIQKSQYYIKKGEIFQIVPSRKFILYCPYPLSAYYTLKNKNPSPYMFFMQDVDFTLFGASPESSLKYNPKNRIVELYPIAGTRSRGFDKNGNLNFDLDSRIELEMRTNQKELSEHLMLVDLARNDLARVCIPGTRFVSRLTKVDRYSHVMHLVSKVIGTLKYDLDALHAYAACMNMGTLTGAPKVRAMQLIATIENNKRGSYGGAIGYFTGLGFLDTCIVIRSAYIENNIATVQSGAGIVIDSIPIEETYESQNKAQVVLNSIVESNYKRKNIK
ncbi:Anthranilate synthase component 1 [Buchnera aphidicola (Myzocallis carpini)]